MVGRPSTVRLAEFSIEVHKRGRRIDGRWHVDMPEPFMPTRADQPFHPAGNSVAYAIQWGFLMGADPIYLLGFTLQSGSPYEWGHQNPVTKRNSFYDTERAMIWLRWVEKNWPGRVRLFPGWSGPIYDCFRLAEVSSFAIREETSPSQARPASSLPWLE